MKIAERIYEVIRSPIVTEKSLSLQEKRVVVFRVSSDATKPEIKKVVELLFNVKVDSVNTLVRKGKTKRFKGIPGRRDTIKKAYVRLSEGYSIDVNEWVVQ
jgi:large subunit ribosomal protein L23